LSGVELPAQSLDASVERAGERLDASVGRTDASFDASVERTDESLDASIEAMRRYYIQRASYYERVYHKPERQADLRAMERWIGEPFAGRDVLEVACGTGWWTPQAAARCRSWLATDINPETLAVAKAKALPPQVEFMEVDAYTLAELGQRGEPGARRFDAAFAGCWWSHVPLSRLPAWLALLHQRLEPGAHVVFLDNSYVQASSTPITRRDAEGNTYQQRTLDDGSTHEVLKNFPTPEEAIAMLGPRARHPRWHPCTHYWILDYTLA
jgi:demethylmenaquinone methyltransferase/2-methoxy-6-polyprenyl-1,4-benzoquinol methylase